MKHLRSAYPLSQNGHDFAGSAGRQGATPVVRLRVAEAVQVLNRRLHEARGAKQQMANLPWFGLWSGWGHGPPHLSNRLGSRHSRRRSALSRKGKHVSLVSANGFGRKPELNNTQPPAEMTCKSGWLRVKVTLAVWDCLLILCGEPSVWWFQHPPMALRESSSGRTGAIGIDTLHLKISVFSLRVKLKIDTRLQPRQDAQKRKLPELAQR